MGLTRVRCQGIHSHLTYKWYGCSKGIRKKPITSSSVQHILLDHKAQSIYNNLGYTSIFWTWYTTLKCLWLLISIVKKTSVFEFQFPKTKWLGKQTKFWPKFQTSMYYNNRGLFCDPNIIANIWGQHMPCATHATLSHMVVLQNGLCFFNGNRS